MNTTETAVSIVDHGVRNGNHRTATLPERIVDSDTGEIIAVPGRLSTIGWEIPEGTTPEEVLPCVNQFLRWQGTINWAIAAGIRYIWHVADDAYADAIEDTGLDYQHLQNIVWVDKSVPISVRTEKLSWSRWLPRGRMCRSEKRTNSGTLFTPREDANFDHFCSKLTHRPNLTITGPLGLPVSVAMMTA